MYQSTKIIDGLSTCFRQWRAKSHCRFLHGYALKFKLTFETENPDIHNWVADFGFLKLPAFEDGTTFKEWFSLVFDHKTIIAADDPMIELFRDYSIKKDNEGPWDLVLMKNVGCEAFAEFVFNFINQKIDLISQNPSLRLVSVECIENEKNSAIYKFQ